MLVTLLDLIKVRYIGVTLLSAHKAQVITLILLQSRGDPHGAPLFPITHSDSVKFCLV